MKRIAFIGTITEDKGSSHLIKLYNESRVHNSENDIKGIFLIHKNIVFQVIEGEADKIAEAVYRSRRDKDLNDFSVVINTHIKEPLYKNWPLRFVNNGNASHAEFIQKLQDVLTRQIVVSNSKDKDLISAIFSIPNSVVKFPIKKSDATALSNDEPNANKLRDGYTGYALSVTTWPKPSQMPMSAQIIKTCSLLSRGFVNYNDLLAKQIWASEIELVKCLNSLNKLGILNATLSKDNKSQATAKPTNDRFSNLLRKFLHSPKAAN
jgi:hypothetical protein